MKRKIVFVIIIQLILNIILGGYLIYSKRTGISLKIKKVFSKETIVTKDQLSKMNKTLMPVFIDTSNNKSGKSYKILVIGNSLSYHPLLENIGWNHISGMAATKQENDFAHLIFKKVESKLPNQNISIRISNLFAFEKNFKTFNFITIDSLISYKPDLIIFQLGENVLFDEINTPVLFENKYVDLINCFKKDSTPIIICTTPFFPSLEKNEIIEKVTLTTRSYLVDLSHLPLLDEENYAKNENDYKGNKNDWKDGGIGVHPGDYGMRNIAQQIFITINATVNSH